MKSIFVLEREDRARTIARLAAFLASCLPGKRVKVEVSLYRQPRSNAQNKALWGLAYKMLHEETGNDPEDLHAYFCGEFWTWVEYDVMGQKRKRPLRTTTTDADGKDSIISIVEFADFFSFIQQRAAEVAGIFIPDPDPLWREHVDAERRKKAKSIALKEIEHGQT